MFMHNFSYSALLVAVLSVVVSPEMTLAFTPPSRRIPSTIYHGSRTSSLLASSSVDAESDVDTTNVNKSTTTTSSASSTKKKMAVLLCPAQFCVPVDYTDLLTTIQSDLQDVDIIATRVAPLPRTEWIKVAKQLPTKDFLDANLSVKITLDWYFDAMEQGLSELFAEGGEDVEVCVIGHSIGGWVARAYLGGLSG